jgi:alanine-glyoxylate transaminase/serine-glyoxylate transaminase/serine-pyruvate transaminase
MNPYDSILMIPGPTQLDEKVRKVMSDPQIGHSSEEFYQNFAELLKLSKNIFKTKKGSPFIITGSGTVGMESTVTSLLEDNSKSLVLNTGHFAERFSMILNSHGLETNQMDFDFGKHADPDELKKEVKKNNYDVVFITHVDTSTTVVNPIKELVKEAKNEGVLTVIDSICGMGGYKLNYDDLGADVVLTCSQKALGSPPGASIMMFSQEALDKIENRKTPIPSYYMNLKRWKEVMDDPRVYLATPAVQIMLALKISFEMILEEGLEKRWKRHEQLAKAIRAGIESLGLKFVAEEGYRADTVTGFYVPEDKSFEIRSNMKEKYKIEVAKGFGKIMKNSLRVGHFGNINKKSVETFLNALEKTTIQYRTNKEENIAINAASEFWDY